MTPRTSAAVRWVVAALALVVTLLVATAVPAAAQTTGSSGGDAAAAAVNTKDGSTVFRFAFNVTRALGDTIDATNAAVAYSSCTDCRTVAISFQIVFVTGSPSTFTPTNEAIAINQECNLCDTMASAYQFVVQASGPVHLTADGNRRLREIERAIRSLDVDALSDAELRAKLDGFAAQIADVLRTDVVAGPPLPDQAGGGDATNAPATTVTTAADTATTTGSTSTTTSTSTPATTTSAPSTTTTATP